MSTFSDELAADVSVVVKAVWGKRDGKVVPETDDLRMANDRVVLSAVMLYADLADSTELARHNQEVAAEVLSATSEASRRLFRRMAEKSAVLTEIESWEFSWETRKILPLLHVD
jgi:hypothetical protein